MQFKRSRMAEHLQNQCEYRNVKCNYCGKDVTFASIKVSSVKIIFKNNSSSSLFLRAQNIISKYRRFKTGLNDTDSWFILASS